MLESLLPLWLWQVSVCQWVSVSKGLSQAPLSTDTVIMVHTHTHAHAQTHTPHTHAHVRACARTHTHTHTPHTNTPHTYIYTHMHHTHTCTRTCMHAHAYTHTHTVSRCSYIHAYGASSLFMMMMHFGVHIFFPGVSHAVWYSVPVVSLPAVDTQTVDRRTLVLLLMPTPSSPVMLMQTLSPVAMATVMVHVPYNILCNRSNRCTGHLPTLVIPKNPSSMVLHNVTI